MMNRREKLFRDESKSRRNPKNEASFSSMLLDEILRSTDTNAEKTGDSKFYTEKPVNRQVIFSAHTDQRSCSIANEEVGSCRKARLVEKWIKDHEFYSSTSCSSDSSGALSAADTAYFVPTKNSRVPCFSSVARPPKPVKICAKSKQEEGISYNQKNKKEADNLIKSKSRASKIYTNFMNMKQPVSPGGKLTSFINSLFNNANHEKESKNFETNKGFRFQDSKKSSKASNSTRASAPSLSRSSSLTKTSPEPTEKMRNGIQSKVRFDPSSVFLDEDFRHKGMGDDEFENFGSSPLVLNGAYNDLKDYQNQRKEDLFMFGKNLKGGEEDDCDNYDGNSDSSSDLFELDHLSVYKNNRFCDGDKINVLYN